MNIGMVITSDDPETVWNAFRFAVFCRRQGEEVRVFLTGRGVAAEHLDTERFKVAEQMRALVEAGGTIQACGTCLKLRSLGGTDLCPLSTMGTLLDLVRGSDRLLTF